MTAPRKDTWVFNAQATSTLLIAAWYVVGVFLALAAVQNGATSGGAVSGAATQTGAAAIASPLFASVSTFYQWGETWVIPLLLGVFYLGAGYLFQRHERVDSFASWRTFMKRKTIVLLTPFFAFTILTLATASVVGTEPELMQVGIIAATPELTLPAFVHAVLVDPVGPVGYFIVLWGFFIIARTPRTKRGMGVLLVLALAAKVVAIGLANADLSGVIPYYAMRMLDNWIWFVAGIALQFFGLQERVTKRSSASAAVAGFVVLGALLFALHWTGAASLAILTALGLLCFYCVSGACFLRGDQVRFYGFVTQYTMAIWLMHQILAKLCFCALFALGISWVGPAAGSPLASAWVPIYALTCLFACYVLPILVMKALSRVWKLGFIVYPSRYLPEKL